MERGKAECSKGATEAHVGQEGACLRFRGSQNDIFT